MNGRDVVNASLKLIGAVAPGETLAAQEAVDGLASLNRMLSGWSNESLMIFSRVREEFALTAGKGTYTMGPAGDFNTTRPQKIDTANIEMQTVTPNVEVPITVFSEREWASIVAKDLTSTLPQGVYAEGSYPLETIDVWPVPTVNHKLVLYSWKQLSSIATLDTVVAMPPGYEEAMVYNLAVRLAPEYGRQVTQEVATIALDSKSAIKRLNHKPAYLRVDDALTRQNKTFNYITGDT